MSVGCTPAAVPAAFRTGQSVIVRELPRSGHSRTPGYVRGRTGRIVAGRGRWPNPELLAYGGADPSGTEVFAVEFEQRDLWPSYRGSQRDRVVVDLWAHWLQEAPAERLPSAHPSMTGGPALPALPASRMDPHDGA